MSTGSRFVDRGAAVDREVFEGLESAVGRALERIRDLERQLEEARGRVTELEELLRAFEAGEGSPAEMKRRLDRLERDNGVMHERLERGRDAAERLLARIRFLEEQR